MDQAEYSKIKRTWINGEHQEEESFGNYLKLNDLNAEFTDIMILKPFEHEQLGDIFGLSIEAWNPIFESVKHELKKDIYHELYPNGWEVSQREAVETVCTSYEYRVLVAGYQDLITGFIAVRLFDED